MVYLVGSVVQRLMALTFLFPVVVKVTLGAVRPGYFAALSEQVEFPFLIGFDVVLAIVGVSLLFRNSAGNLLGYVDSRALAVVRAVIMSALTAAAILLSLSSLAHLGVIEGMGQDGVMAAALGFWLIFFVCCIFPGWYRRKVWQVPDPAAEEAHVLDLTLPRRPPARAARGPAPPVTAHMGAGAWMATLAMVVLFCVIVAGGIHGALSARFLPSEAHLARVAQALVPLGAICAVLLVLFALTGPRPTGRTALGSAFWRSALALVGVSAGFYLGAEPALRSGLPDIAAQLDGGAERAVRARVVAREQDFGAHWCDRSAVVEMDVGEGRRTYRLCALDPDIWAALRRGTLLEVRGIETAHGFRYTRVGRA